MMGPNEDGEGGVLPGVRYASNFQLVLFYIIISLVLCLPLGEQIIMKCSTIKYAKGIIDKIVIFEEKGKKKYDIVIDFKVDGRLYTETMTVDTLINKSIKTGDKVNLIYYSTLSPKIRRVDYELYLYPEREKEIKHKRINEKDFGNNMSNINFVLIMLLIYSFIFLIVVVISRKLLKNEEEKIRELYKDGLSIKEISEKMELIEEHIQKVLGMVDKTYYQIYKEYKKKQDEIERNENI